MASTASPMDGPGANTQPDRPDLFISYSRRDRAFVETRLLPSLTARGKAVWLDLEDIPPAADWRERIADGIQAARAFVFVLTPESIASPVCRDELRRAVEANKRLIPILRRDVDPQAVPEQLERPNWVLLRDEDYFEAQFERLVHALETDLEWIDTHARLGVRAREWDRSGQDRGRLLRGSDLEAAEHWLQGQASHAEAATSDQVAYVLASRQSATRRQRVTLAAVATALVASLALGALALIQRNLAVSNEETARSRELAARAQLLTDQGNLDTAALLSLEAYRAKPTADAKSAVLSILPRLEGSRGALVGHTQGVNAVAASPDGRTVATAGDDYTVRLWDLASRRVLARLDPGVEDPIESVAFSPDGRMLASASTGAVRLWDLRTRRPAGEPLEVWNRDVKAVEFPEDVNTVAFTPDGRTIAAGGAIDGGIRLWDLRTRRRLGRDLVGHTDPVTSVAFGADGHTMASASEDGTLRLWDLRTRRPSGAALTGHVGEVNGAAFSPDGTTLASGGYDKTVRLWDVVTHRALGRPLRGHAGAVASVAFSPDGGTLASGGGSTARLWDVGTRRAVGSPLSAHNGPVSSVTFARDGETLASASADGTVRLWDAGRRRGLRLAITGHRGRVPSVSLSPDGRTLASAGYEDGTVRLWDARRRRALGGPLPLAPILIGGIEMPFPFVPVAVAFSPDGRSLAAASHHDATIRLWDMRRRRAIGKPMIGFSGAFAGGLAFSPDGRTLAALGEVGDRHTVRLWSVRSRRAVGALPSAHTGEILSVAFSPDGRTLATGSMDQTVRLWNVRTRRPLGGPLIGHSDLVYRVAFSPDGKTLASASSDATVRLWDVGARHALGAPLTGHTGGVQGVAFSPDGRTLASAAEDETVRLWDVHARIPIGAPLTGHTDQVETVAFAPDGRTLASAGNDGTIRLWDRILWSDDAAALRERVCEGVRRPLGRAEWSQFVPDRPYHETCMPRST